MNYQSWEGFTDARFGYGAMLAGFVDHAPLSVKLVPKATVHVHMGVPMSVKGWWEGQHRVLFTMWETSELPTSFQRWLPQFDQVLVPCEHNVELFSKHHKNVRYVPLGVDTDVWCPQPHTPASTFKFTAGGSLWRRKGLDLVVKAFHMLGLKDAELHIKAAPHARDVPEKGLGERVFLHRQWMSMKDQVAWFNDSDCFVAPARGEGFGLIPLQNIALGVPTIVSDSTGQSQFAHLAAGVVRCDKSTSETVGWWDEPNVSDLADQMLRVYRNRKQARVEAIQRAPEANQFTWAKAAEALVAAVPAGKLSTSKVFVESGLPVRVVAQRKVDATIGANRIKLSSGQVTEVPEGVYQVLYDSGAVRMVDDGS